MSDITITPIPDKVFGASVTGVELASITDETFAVMHTAYLEHGFLLFPNQFLSDAENIAFGERFGELEFGANPMSNQHRHRDGTYGKVFDIDTQRMRTNVGNEAWHTDSTYKPLSSKCAMLSAVTVPAKGGETALADQRAAYDALDDETRDRIANLSAYHSTEFSQANDLGDFPPREKDSIYHGEAYLRPMVKIHPETARPALFVGRHAFGIPGLERSESRALLKQLIDFVVSDESRVYTHQWTAGDTLLWDNRYVLHRAMPYDYSEPRVLIGTRIAGDPDTELAYYPEDPAAQAGREALDVELSVLREEAGDRRYGATTAEQAT
ncbi:MAG: taurine catabolism dioxygenase TauD [Gammaproteobacteria bacterium]|nr:taurine catabolism dioxygenase TauD [Gammaproteobacteria bacterium]RPG23865.1 MAG: TauD/TfdA family dioxygenase [Gammaproteobacteria bacterium TMED50]|tara:strand:+ start:7745 stop:8719 length:975 start_codon:yes stop_codon:yes gene_type:complete